MRWRCECSTCGRTLRAPLETRVLFHRCIRPAEKRAFELFAGTTREEAKTALWHALLHAQGPTSIWRPLEGGRP